MTSNGEKYRAIEILREASIANPKRLVKLIWDIIAFLELDLSGMTILTEAASGPYVVTPVIASLAGAKQVLALTHDSRYATTDAVIAQTRALEELCDIKSKVDIYTERSLDLFARADIITNLGFVRPIDAEAITVMKSTAVIPLMCESWEYRLGDVDLDACKTIEIVVLGTNEDYAGLEIFAYTGWLCMKMLFEAQIEIHKSKLLIVSSDKFGMVIEKRLRSSGVLARTVSSLRDVINKDLREIDAVIVADYTRNDTIIGEGGDISPSMLAGAIPHATVIQFAGQIDVDGLVANGCRVYPGIKIGPNRMALTLSHLSPRPVVELHAAGLKVAEFGARARLSGMTPDQAEEFVLETSRIAQRLAASAKGR